MPWEKQFDTKEALKKAGCAFWANGYEGTSMTELLKQMGIQKGSFYATFGSKHQVLMDSLEEYVRERGARFEALASDASPRTALERHLREIFAEACGKEGDMGCFVINMALEMAPKDEAVRAVIQRALAALEKGYRQLLESAQRQGEISSKLNPRTTARSILALILGARVLSRASVSRSVMESIQDQTLKLLDE